MGKIKEKSLIIVIVIFLLHMLTSHMPLDVHLVERDSLTFTLLEYQMQIESEHALC